MADALDPGADRFREEVRLRALARAGASKSPVPRSLRVGAIAVAVVLHLGAAMALYFLMQRHPARDADRIAVRLLDTPPAEPALPEPPPPTPRQAALPSKPVPALSRPSSPPLRTAAPVAPNKAAATDTLSLFNADGSVRSPAPSPFAKPAPHEEQIERGRELMARGLDCTAHDADDLAHRESVGEEVTRKYLSWIGLYNPAAAQRRAEEEEKRQVRCRMWKGAGQ